MVFKYFPLVEEKQHYIKLAIIAIFLSTHRGHWGSHICADYLAGNWYSLLRGSDEDHQE